MKYSISADRKQLTITVNESERNELTQMDHIQSDKALYDFFEYLIANSELQWISPEETGDLTDAPMLGIKNEKDIVEERWAFMDYMLRSPLEDLKEKEKVVFSAGY